MSEANVSNESGAPAVQSPPLSSVPAQESQADPRRALHKLASELMRAHNRKLLMEFLQLRRALR